jgi:uncharacterized membrane protein YccC
MVKSMRSIRSFFLTLAGLTLVAIVALFTASIGIAIAGAVSVLLFGQWLSSLLAGNEREPVRAYARTQRTPDGRPVRVWNDGKGTIIDM